VRNDCPNLLYRRTSGGAALRRADSRRADRNSGAFERAYGLVRRLGCRLVRGHA